MVMKAPKNMRSLFMSAFLFMPALSSAIGEAFVCEFHSVSFLSVSFLSTSYVNDIFAHLSNQLYLQTFYLCGTTASWKF
ncbi:hypothetical protein BYT27DRAFT_7185414 [Phlegmacium glaucopus]|nr:hypothetical protein BYT27DRAFT_7185414 [Phlegmacium glaucopus]